MTCTRRLILGFAAATSLAPALAQARGIDASQPGAPDESVTLTASDGRGVDVAVWAPKDIKGGVVFSHGLGSGPAPYGPMLSLWREAGFLVMAPRHVDSRAHPEHDRYDSRAGFKARLLDMQAVLDALAQRAPDAPLAAAGHSYGSLFAEMTAGAMEARFHRTDPRVRAVVAFSSPGMISGLMDEAAFSGLAAPLLLITGDQDRIAGAVEDPAEHLRPFLSSPVGDKYALVIPGADHGVVRAAGAPAFMRAAQASSLFLRAVVLKQAAARKALTRMAADPDSGLRTR